MFMQIHANLELVVAYVNIAIYIYLLYTVVRLCITNRVGHTKTAILATTIAYQTQENIPRNTKNTFGIQEENKINKDRQLIDSQNISKSCANAMLFSILFQQPNRIQSYRHRDGLRSFGHSPTYAPVAVATHKVLSFKVRLSRNILIKHDKDT